MLKWVLFFSIGLMLIFPVTPAYPENMVKKFRAAGPEKKPVSTFTCDDGLQCTQDTIVNGKCSHSIKDGFCLINRVCYARDQANPQNPCQVCRDNLGDAYKSRWGYDNANPCSDGDSCTDNDHCDSGVCKGVLRPNCP